MPPLPLPLFSAADDPWIEVRTGQTYDSVGLRNLLLRAHTFDDLAVPSPPAASALLRIAAAITARVTGLDDPDLSAAQWTALRRQRFGDGQFDPDTVHAYFDRHHFSVFDPVRPWLQDPALREQCDRPAGINAFVPGRPAGNNLAWFSPHNHHTATPVPTAQALQHLLIHHFYGRAGAGTPRTVGATTSKYLSSGPLRATVSFHPLGRTLHETLLAGLPKYLGDEQLLPDASPWEDLDPVDPLAAPHPVTWPGRLLTGRSRHAVLLLPGPDGTTVSDAYLTWSTQHPKLEATDPYLAYHIDADKPVERRRTVRRADADRAWWRELDTLLLAPDEHSTQRRPEIFDTLNDLPSPLRSTLRIRVHGFDQDPKTIDRQWYTARTPPLLNWTQEHDPARAQRIADCCQAAEHIAKRLTTVANRAWAETTTPRPGGETPPKVRKGKDCAWTHKARAKYWPLAEAVFWSLLDEPDTPASTAFAKAAATALREATATARARHKAAARAIATAVNDLFGHLSPSRKST
ncbi:type I-E CRISPR-associated protein Cse1/CasA [Streptomyces sp. ISL-99]|uniref:type I-E CRISPR-associated protein Cse1/CasA n=1 Tax=Streptomyces sp. ISL-99 TaxID=2819193 RepID=UPI001BEB92F7|nr:type I-E CRISPR-associated protein Cse1/CasA [Streptomyces sp. ISL-99]MBT2530139.1 type I-E CRISPR-associated protein Cse1/CasA [Streptomyces sp. ISL-99]